MGANFDDLKAEVARDNDVKSSAITALGNVAQRVADAVAADNLDDDTETAKLAADLKAQTDALAQAIADNTPSAPPPTP